MYFYKHRAIDILVYVVIDYEEKIYLYSTQTLAVFILHFIELFSNIYIVSKYYSLYFTFYIFEYIFVFKYLQFTHSI